MGSGGVSYLPFVSGILAANAKKISLLKKVLNLKNLYLSQKQVTILSKIIMMKNLILLFFNLYVE